MKFIIRLLFLFFLLVCIDLQGQDCKILLDSINKLWEGGKFDVSLAQRVDSICLEEVGNQDTLYADILVARAFAIMANGDPNYAIHLIQKAKRICLTSRGLYDKNTGSLYSSEGMIYAQMGDIARSLPALDTSLLIKKHLGDSSATLGAAYAIRGQILFLSGKYLDAKTDILLSIQNAKNNHLDSIGYQYLARISILGLILTYLGDNLEATPILEQSVRIATALLGEKNITTITAIGNLAQNYSITGEFEKALVNIQRALLLAKKFMPNHPNTNAIRGNCGAIFLRQGRYSEALNLLLQTKAIEEQQRRFVPADYATLLGNIGVTYLERYDFPKALPYLTEAREQMADALGKDNPRFALMTHNLSVCHFKLGNTQLARSLTEESFGFIESFGESFPDYEKFLTNMVLLTEKNKGLLLRMGQAKDIVGKKFGKRSVPFGIYLGYYAACVANSGREKEAISLFKKAEKILHKTQRQHTKDFLEILRNLAKCNARLNNETQSISYYRKALDLTETSLGIENSFYASLLDGAAGIEERQGKNRTAFVHYLAADTLYHRISARNFAVLSEAGREFFQADINPQMDRWHSFAWRHATTFPEIPALLFDDQLSEKGQLLHSARSVLASLRGDTMLEGQMTKWLGLRQSIDVQRGKLAQKDTTALYTAFELDSLARVAELLEITLTQKSKAFAAATKPVDWRDVQARLAPGEAAVEFFHFRYYKPDTPTDSILYGALVLRKGDQAPQFIPLFEEKQLSAVLTRKAIGETEWLKRLYPANADGPSKLYNLVWQPLEKELAGVNRVWYSPSGLLHRVAFPAISKARGERLLDNLDLQQIGSAHELATDLPEQAGTPKSALIYACVSYPTDSLKMSLRFRECLGDPGWIGAKGGDNNLPLPNSLFEADTVEVQLQAVGAHVETLMGYEAMEDDTKKRLSEGNSPDVLMFTTHGFAWDTLPIAFKGRFPPHNPMYSSGLLLAGSDTVWVGGPVPTGFQEDGILTAREIGDLDLQHTRLAILSACKSGLGEANSSEGVYGLQRAFKLAGTKQVLATLWEIPDSPETRDFIGQFCHRWLSTGDARAALRDTQRDFDRRGGRLKVWGAWVLI